MPTSRFSPPAGLLLGLAVFAVSPLVEAAEGVRSAPLSSKSPPPGGDGPLFRSVPPSESGIEFMNSYDDPLMWGRLYREFTLGAVGAGVAIGDYDGDGRPDIYAVNKNGPNALYRQTGDFVFEDVTERAGVAGSDAWSTGVTFVDINNDGWLDLYLCQFDAPNQLFVNQGDGTFSEEAAEYGLDVSDASVMAAFADYDRDGDLDVYLQTNILDYNQSFKGRPDYFFRNNGDGTFENVTAEAGIWGITQGHSATWWDYNHDGWPDIYVANDFENSDRLYHNNGDGTFTDTLGELIPHTSYFSMGSDLGDVTNDGLTEFFVGDMAATTHAKDKTGMAEMGRGIWENERVESLFPMYMRNAFYLNTGADRFKEIAYLNQMDATDWTWAVKFSDLDNDGWNDLFITNGNIRNFMEADLLDKQNVASSLAARIRVYRNAPPLKEYNLAFRNEGDLAFSNVSAEWGLDHFGVSFGAAYADLDRDGDLDLVVNNFEENLLVYRNGAQANGMLIRLEGTTSNRFGIGALLTLESSAGLQTRQLTLARGVLSSDEPLVHFGLGEDESAGRLEIHWPSGHRQVLENLAANHLHTIREPDGPATLPPAQGSALDYRLAAQFHEVGAQRGLDILHQDSYFNELADQLLLPRRLARSGPPLAWGDVNGDGSYDLIVGGAAGRANSVLLNDGRGRFSPGELPSLQGDPAAETLGLLHFGHRLYTANGSVEGHYQDAILSLDGKAIRSPVDQSTSVVVAADFDQDGDLDLFVGSRSVPGRYPQTPRNYLLENRDGAFVDVTEEKAPGLIDIGMVVAAIWSDATGDGRPDLLLARDWQSIAVFTNEGGALRESTSSTGMEPYTGWWSSIVAGDFNGDGHLDYAVGNAGLNTKYLASPERPTLLFDGVFEPGGERHLLEAQYEDGDDKLYPIRPYSKLRYAFPSLRSKFDSFASFAQATVEEIFGAEILAAADRFEANTLASGVFLNQGDGSFRFRPLPRLAQVAPIFGMVAQDLDGDGHTDLYAVQNSFAPEPTTGRFNGGVSVLLRGDGSGGFTAELPGRSGLIVPGDGKALTVTDLQGDGWPDLVASQNGGPLLAFENRGVDGRKAFSVSLRSKATGNPHGIGSRIALIRRNGSRSYAEIASASGYLSQSPPWAFFGYVEANAPVSIEVRWPDGSTSQHPFTPDKPHLDLTQPQVAAKSEP